MQNNHDLPIAVIGGGPKAAALAAKSRVLRDNGHSCPEIVIVEQHEVAANWSGKFGFTSGQQRLGTPPEKDIGFPYNSDSIDPKITRSLFRDYSWISYKIFDRETFSEWVDRGRPHPTHKEWGKYLAWVISRSGAKIIKGKVTSISLNEDSWIVGTTSGSKIHCSGVVFTGPGPSKKLPIDVPKDGMISMGDDFWTNLDSISRLQNDESKPIVVIGGGETAASVTNYLISNVSSSIPILVLTRSGAIFTRGEGYYENRMFTDFGTWQNLPRSVREDVIRRGDRGVFSVDVIKNISYAHNVDHGFLEVKSIVKIDECFFRINGEIDCQMIVVAAGFNPEWFLDLFDKDVRSKIPENLAENIGHDLSVNLNDVKAKIFVPMLASLQQGPGFPNLSCLGTFSDRIFGRTPA